MNIRDVIFGIVFIVFGACIYYDTLDYPKAGPGLPGPDFFPRIVSILIIIFALVLTIKGLLEKDFKIDFPSFSNIFRSSGFYNAISIILGVIAYIYLVNVLGYILTIFLILFVTMMLMKVPIYHNIIITLSITFGTYFLFGIVLKINLPMGVFR
ncbi:MAG: tripartite tricarboxylate transporter TctB family protein [Candidatus Methanomethylicia archaeon]